MKKYIFLINIIYSLFAAPIKEIIIQGNKITQNDFILNTINHQVGDTINENLMHQDMLNLFETDLFEDVMIYYSPIDSIYSIYLLNEKAKIRPFPIFGKDDLLGFYYGGGILFNNIQGINKKLAFGISTGEILSYNLTYYNPKSSLTQDTLKINFHNKRFDNIEDDYLLDKSIFKASLNLPIKNKAHKLNFSFEYEYNKINFLKIDNTEKNYSIAAIASYRRNNYLDKNKSGNILDFNSKLTLFNMYFPNNITLKLLNKYYVPFSISPDKVRLLIKSQAKINFSTNIPIYNRIYIGTENHVRGYNPNPLENPSGIQKRLKSNNMIASTLQLEVLLIKKEVLDISLLLFADWGIGADYYKNFNIKNKIRSHGIGLRINQEKLFNVDLFLGFNPYKDKQFQVIFNETFF